MFRKNGFWGLNWIVLRIKCSMSSWSAWFSSIFTLAIHRFISPGLCINWHVAITDTWARFWTHTKLLFFSHFMSALDMCIMPTKLAGNEDCPPDNANVRAKNCVAKYITAESCTAAGGNWTKFITNYLEKTGGNASNCEAQGDLKLAKGLPYEPHKLSQGSDEQEQYVYLHKTPDVIYAPSSVVNHNGVNMRGTFSSYKWKVPCFPSTTTQRCVIRLRWEKLLP